MRTRRNPALWFAAVLALSAACGDDTDNGDEGNNNGDNSTGDNNANSTGDGNTGNTGDEVDLSASCIKDGIYDGHKGQEIKDKIGKGACTTDVQIAEVCKINPSTAAADAGGVCFINGLSGDALRMCTVEGDKGLGVDGLRKKAPNLSDGCLDCYAEAVACSAENDCGPDCIAAPTGEKCITCRETNGCTPGFYTCSGLPRIEDL